MMKQKIKAKEENNSVEAFNQKTYDRLVQENQKLQAQLSLIQDQVSLKDDGFYRQQHLMLLEKLVRAVENMEGSNTIDSSEEDESEDEEDNEI